LLPSCFSKLLPLVVFFPDPALLFFFFSEQPNQNAKGFLTKNEFIEALPLLNPSTAAPLTSAIDEAVSSCSLFLPDHLQNAYLEYIEFLEEIEKVSKDWGE
jgi:hypothetical protein